MKCFIKSYENLREFIEYDLYYFNITYHNYLNGYKTEQDFNNYNYAMTKILNVYSSIFPEYYFKIVLNKTFNDFEVEVWRTKTIFKPAKMIDTIK